MQQPPNEGAGGTGSELRSDAQQLSSKAADRLHSEVDSRKGQAAEQAKSVSSAIERTAGELDEGAPAWLKSAFRQSADQIQRFAEAMEQRDSRQILNEVQSFARERPALFLGACAAAGFAAARVFKAGGEQQNRDQFGQSGSFDQAGSSGQIASYGQGGSFGDGRGASGGQGSSQGQQFGRTQSGSQQQTGSGGAQSQGSTGTQTSSRGEFV